MTHKLDCLIRPRSVAVLGASSKRMNNGNVVVANLRAAGYSGAVLPIHPEVAQIEGYAAVAEVAALPAGTDVAVVSVPAAGVAAALRALDRAGVGAAIVMTAGFSAPESAEIAEIARTSRLIVQGPNCMGLLNVSDGIPLYTAIPSARVKPGRAALIAQSGSAAISVMNSTDVGFSKVITSGSQFSLSAAEYLDWLAGDPHTAVIGLVLESIPDADRFADALDLVHASGRAVVMLKVGHSDLGALATQAHTGAMIRDRDATDGYFRRYGVPTVRDYDELVAALEAFATTRARPRSNRIGIAGISGGEAALACDLAAQMNVPITNFTAETVTRLKELLPGTNGCNPIDFGASVAVAGTRQETAALDVIAADPNVDTIFILQDAQHSLAWRSSGRYVGQVRNVAELGRRTDKPIVVVSSSGEALHGDIKGALDGTEIPLLRGLRPALAAMDCMGTWFARAPEPRRIGGRTLSGEKAALHSALAGLRGAVPAALTARLLAAYDLPVVRSAVARNAEEAVRLAADIGERLVVKVVSRDVPHRSDVGAVMLGISGPAALRDAVATITARVHAGLPGAIIDGYELQEELAGAVEAMIGFKATPPFGALLVVGTGGTLVELQNDRDMNLCPVTPAEAESMLRRTRLGKLLAGYRNLVPPTDLAALSASVAALSELAADMHEVLSACDLNPVMVRPGAGDARIVDALFVAGGARQEMRSP